MLYQLIQNMHLKYVRSTSQADVYAIWTGNLSQIYNGKPEGSELYFYNEKRQLLVGEFFVRHLGEGMGFGWSESKASSPKDDVYILYPETQPQKEDSPEVEEFLQNHVNGLS